MQLRKVDKQIKKHLTNKNGLVYNSDMFILCATKLCLVVHKIHNALYIYKKEKVS